MTGTVRRRSSAGDIKAAGLEFVDGMLDDIECTVATDQLLAARACKTKQVFLGLGIISAGYRPGTTVECKRIVVSVTGHPLVLPVPGLLVDTFQVHEERIIQCVVLQALKSTGLAAMAGLHVSFE